MVFRTSFPLPSLSGPALALALLWAAPATAAGPPPPPNDPGGKERKLLLIPFVLGNSDELLLLGAGVGYSEPPTRYVLLGLQASLAGRLSADVEGELSLGRWRHAGKVGFSRYRMDLYPAAGVDPAPTASAVVENTDLKLSALRRVGERTELGPAVWIEHAVGLDPEDPRTGASLDVADHPRLRSGSLALAGVRARWRTTRPVRPVDGVILDGFAQFGAADAAGWEGPRLDGALQGSAALARPLGRNWRLYLRGDARMQLNAPPAVRNYIGGDKKVRGQPYRREVGRQVLLGRAQLHWTLTRAFRLPFAVLHAIHEGIPAWAMEVELVPFYDVGAAGNPGQPWHPTRHGIGAGVHFVLPPELVLRMDVGWSPGAESPRFYIGVGESF